jgi:hypothetical protein
MVTDQSSVVAIWNWNPVFCYTVRFRCFRFKSCLSSSGSLEFLFFKCFLPECKGFFFAIALVPVIVFLTSSDVTWSAFVNLDSWKLTQFLGLSFVWSETLSSWRLVWGTVGTHWFCIGSVASVRTWSSQELEIVFFWCYNISESDNFQFLILFIPVRGHCRKSTDWSGYSMMVWVV